MRKLITNGYTESVFNDIRDKLNFRLSEKGMHSFASIHEILGILTEEYTELIDAVKDNSRETVREELIDIIVASIWGIVSIDANAIDW